MATPIIAGVAVAGAAMLGRAALILVRGGGSGVGAAAGAKAASWLTFGAGAKGAANMGAARGLPRIPRAYQGPFEADMTRAEALKVLGIREGASRDAIRDSHRRLMRLNHPDTGGSPALATKINEAKDFCCPEEEVCFE